MKHIYRFIVQWSIFTIVQLSIVQGTDEMIPYKAVEVTEVRDVLFLKRITGEVTCFTIVQCAMVCVGDKTCVALSYNSNSRSCRMYDAIFSSHSINGNITSWRSYNVYPEWCPVHNGFKYLSKNPGEMCIKVIAGYVTCVEAKLKCSEENSSLPIVDTEKKNAMIVAAREEHNLQVVFLDAFFNNQWYWRSNKPLSAGFEYWDDGEPSTNKFDDCVGSVNFSLALRWHDMPNYMKFHGFICEIRHE